MGSCPDTDIDHDDVQLSHTCRYSALLRWYWHLPCAPRHTSGPEIDTLQLLYCLHEDNQP